MQLQSVKILRTKNNSLMVYYHSEGNLLLKKYENSHFTQPETVMTDVLPNFSVCVSYDDTPYVLCCNTAGNIYFCKRTKQSWDKKLILENSYSKNQFSKFAIFMKKDMLYFIYSIPAEDSKTHYLMLLTYKNGQWETPTKIDTIIPFHYTSFIVHSVNENHFVLFYKTNMNTISTRELLISPLTLGTLTPIIHNLNCSDLSVLTSEDKIHIVYIVKGNFSSQLLYKNKLSTKISSPLTIYEGQRIENCIIFKIKSTIWIMWASSGHLYYVTSENGGHSFSNPLKYQYSFHSQSSKVEYINQSDSEFEAQEIYVNSSNQNEIMVIPDIYSGFYNAPEPKIIQSQSSNLSSKETIDKLKNKLYQLELSSKEKTEQLLQITKDLSQRSNEVSQTNAQWHNKVNILKSEIKQLTTSLNEKIDQIKTLESNLTQSYAENEKLKNKISKLESNVDHPNENLNHQN